MQRRVAIALGSNLGDRAAHLDFAVARLGPLLDGLRVSSYHTTAPVDVVGPQPDFLNAAAVGWSADPPAVLLRHLQAIESARSRRRSHRGAARTLDLDLVICGDLVVHEPDLEVPHPRFRERRFVLAPLAEIAPDLLDPVTTLSVADLLRRLPPG